MEFNKTKEFINYSFKDIDKLAQTAKSSIKMTDETIGAGSKSDKYTFNAYLIDKINKSMTKVWDEKHMNKNFEELDGGMKLPKINKIS